MAIKKSELNVLIVDDMTYIRLKLVKLLKEIGFVNVFQTGDGEHAIELFKKFSPHIIILDLSLPKIDPFSLINLFLTLKPETIIIVSNSVYDEELFNKALKKGAVRFFSKPINFEDFNQLMNNVYNKYILAGKSEDGKLASQEIEDVSKNFDITLNSGKSFQLFRLKDVLNKKKFFDLRNLIVSFQIYKYLNVILNLKNVIKLDVSNTELLELKELVESEGGKFFIILNKDTLLWNNLLNTELKDNLYSTEEEPVRLL